MSTGKRTSLRGGEASFAFCVTPVVSENSYGLDIPPRPRAGSCRPGTCQAQGALYPPQRNQHNRSSEDDHGARWELTLQNQYLRAENKMLRTKLPRRITFTDDERRLLVDAALAMGKKLMRQVVSLVKPDTILAWQRRLARQKWDYSHRRQHKPGRPKTPDNIERNA